MTRSAIAALLLLAAAACGPAIGRPAVEPGRESTTLPPSYVETTTANGEIIGVDRATPGRELAEGLTIRLQADAERPIVVQLAPGWYLDENGIGYGPRERLVVRGRREVRQGRSVFVATEVRQGDRWVPLRDETGRPVWERQSPSGQ